MDNYIENHLFKDINLINKKNKNNDVCINSSSELISSYKKYLNEIRKPINNKPLKQNQNGEYILPKNSLINIVLEGTIYMKNNNVPISINHIYNLYTTDSEVISCQTWVNIECNINVMKKTFIIMEHLYNSLFGNKHMKTTMEQKIFIYNVITNGLFKKWVIHNLKINNINIDNDRNYYKFIEKIEIDVKYITII